LSRRCCGRLLNDELALQVRLVGDLPSMRLDTGISRERRDQLRHPVYAKPELLAEAPNQVWS
jgi:hypothetical protein